MSLTEGPNACGTGSNYNDGGDIAWTDPANVQVDNSDYAHAIQYQPVPSTQALYAKNFGFTIPTNAIITNVTFSYKRRCSLARITEKNVVMCDSSGNPTGIDKADVITTWGTTTETITKSGDSDYWGMPLTPALVNDADFGLKISASLITGSGDTAFVLYISCTVTYVFPSGARAQLIGPIW